MSMSCLQVVYIRKSINELSGQVFLNNTARAVILQLNGHIFQYTKSVLLNGGFKLSLVETQIKPRYET